MAMQMDSSSDEDITVVITANNEFFYNYYVNALSDNDCKDDTDVLLAATRLLHNHNEVMLPSGRGSCQAEPKI
jgi:hypothetical protein